MRKQREKASPSLPGSSKRRASGGVWSCRLQSSGLDFVLFGFKRIICYQFCWLDLNRPHVVGFFWLRRLKQEVLAPLFLLMLEHGPHPLGDEWSPPGNEWPPLLPGTWTLVRSPEAGSRSTEPRLPTWDPLGSFLLSLCPYSAPSPSSAKGIFCQAYLPNWSGYIAKPQMWSYLFVSVLGFFFVIVFPVCFIEISLA